MDPRNEISQMMAQLNGILESREKALQEREVALDKRLRLFEESYPQAGKESDVLHLNVGGSLNVAVLRRTVTNFEESMLASRFSGRWDDSLEKDKDGNFFIDENPKLFLQLLNYLRQCDKNKRDDLTIPPPLPTFEFCWMLEYYDLMHVVYPQEWEKVWGGETAVLTRPTPGNNSFTIQTSIMGAFMLELDKDCELKPENASGFVAVFEQGSTGQIGWADGCHSGHKIGYQNDSLAIDLESTCVKAKSQVTRDYNDVWQRESSVTIRCTYHRYTDTYTVQIEGAPSVCGGTLTTTTQMTPHISVIGKVTISNVLYSY